MSTRDAHRLAEGNVKFLRQGLALVRRISDRDFADPAPNTARGGVGAHFRHILDHYECFLRDLGDGRIDYDRRERDPALERVRARALERLEAVSSALERLGDLDGSHALAVTVDCGEGHAPIWSASTLARELQFLVSHTVHHFAVIAVLLRTRGIEPGADFGVAPSTLKFEQGAPVCAR